jgi:hypothetical protein
VLKERREEREREEEGPEHAMRGKSAGSRTFEEERFGVE